jgi:hypothetical protein
MTHAEYLFHGVFFVLVFGVPIYLVVASYSGHCGINVSALWTSHANGQVDTLLVIVLGTWWVHTCAMVLWILSRNLSHDNVTQYMGWAIPIIASMFARKPETPKP